MASDVTGTWDVEVRPWHLGRQCALAVFLLCGLSSTVAASPSSDLKEKALKSLQEVEGRAKKLLVSTKKSTKATPEAMVAAAELHFRTGQFEAVIDKLSRVVELHQQRKASDSTGADAHFLLGRAYFSTGQLYSARRHFELVTDRAEEPSYAAMGGPSASRLVDIALSTHRRETLPDVLARVDRMLARSSNDSLRYARSKALFAMNRYGDALNEASRIDTGSLYTQRAAYLSGTALMKLADAAALKKGRPDYQLSLSAFLKATKGTSARKQDETDSKRISVLAWLAIARLHYALGRYGSASDAYRKVPRSSELFSQALFELAWTYVRLGDYERGQRSLEALSVLDPGLTDGADGELLRGDLLLRSGRFEESDEAYRHVRTKYEPLFARVDEYLQKNADSAVFYDRLTAAEIESSDALPSVALDWAREEADEGRVFAIVDEVARSRKLVRRSRRMIALLRASLSSESRVKLFPSLERNLQEALSLLNRLALVRLTLANGMDEVAGAATGELYRVRIERRSLMARLAELPTTPGNFSVRQSRAEDTWNRVSQQLQRLRLEADHLRALVNGLRRVVSETGEYGVTLSPDERRRFAAELAQNERDLLGYFSRIKDLRQKVELARVQTGLGGEAFVEDDRVRSLFRTVFAQEIESSARYAGKSEAVYAGSLVKVLKRMSAVEISVSTLRKRIEEQSLFQAKEMWQSVEREAKAMETYAARLELMDQNARLLVGEVARDNLGKVRDRLADVVLRADVGMVQQSWEVRESQRSRIRDLLRQRSREERIVDDEMHEVLEDGSGVQQ